MYTADFFLSNGLKHSDLEVTKFVIICAIKYINKTGIKDKI